MTKVKCTFDKCLFNNDGICQKEEIELDYRVRYGESWVVILKFENYDKANEWAEAHGYEGQCRKGTKTTVIRVDNE